MHILMSNDDGIFAPGIRALACAAKAAGHRVTLFAPDRQRSAAGHSATLNAPLHVRQVEYPDGIPAYAVDGTPADCVRLGLYLLSDDRPDCVLSGINRGSNRGAAILYSGTVGAAMEGSLCGFPAAAVSLCAYRDDGYETAARYGVKLAEWMMQNQLPLGEIYNLNVPEGEVHGIRAATISNEYIFPPRYVFEDGGYTLDRNVDTMPETDENSDLSVCNAGYASLSVLTRNVLSEKQPDLTALAKQLNKLEIERKYLIRMPDEAFLRSQPGCQIWDIEQLYLENAADGATRRLRKLVEKGETRCYYTQKQRIDAMTCIEDEREISVGEYEKLCLEADKTRHTIRKRRYRIPWQNRLLEIDIYDFWQDRATLEVELDDADESVTLPDWISLVREVTGDKRYTNRSLAKAVPFDDTAKD